MIMFMLLNPDLQWPYQFELDQLQNKNLEQSEKELVRTFMHQMKPTFSDNYCILQPTTWLKVDEIYAQCTKFVLPDRPSAEQIVARLQVRDDNRLISRNIPLSISQSTTVEGHDRLVALGTASGGDIPGNSSGTHYRQRYVANFMLKKTNRTTIWYIVIVLLGGVPYGYVPLWTQESQAVNTTYKNDRGWRLKTHWINPRRFQTPCNKSDKLRHLWQHHSVFWRTKVVHQDGGSYDVHTCIFSNNVFW